MSIQEFLISALVTWAVILIPPAVVRASTRRPLLKTGAIAWAFILFLGNHLFFAWLTDEASPRPFHFIGAIAAFYVLTWQSRKHAELANAELRRFLGYDQDGSASSDRDGASSENQAGEKKPGDRGASAGLSGPTAQGAVSSTVVSQTADPAHSAESQVTSQTMGSLKSTGSSLNWSRGFFRLWVVVSVLWVGAISMNTYLAITAPSSGWFVHRYEVGSVTTPDNVERTLGWHLKQIRNPGSAPDGPGQPPVSEFLAGFAAEQLAGVAVVAEKSGIPRPSDPLQISIMAGLTPDQVRANLEIATHIAMGNELLAAAKSNPYAWPASFDTRQRVHEIEWDRFWIFVLGGPLLALGFGLTVRWISRGLMSST